MFPFSFIYMKRAYRYMCQLVPMLLISQLSAHLYAEDRPLDCSQWKTWLFFMSVLIFRWGQALFRFGSIFWKFSALSSWVFRYSLNLVFWIFFTNFPISRNKCLSRFLYKYKNGFFRKPSHRSLMLCKHKMYIILIEKLLLLRIFLQNKSFSNKIQKIILF